MRKKAFTLVELLIVMVIVGIVFVMIFRVYGIIIDNTKRVNDIVIMSQQIQLTHNTMQSFLGGKRFAYETTIRTGTEWFADAVWFADREWFVTTLWYNPCSLTSCVLTLTEEATDLVIPLLDKTQVVIDQPRFYLLPQQEITGDIALSTWWIANPHIIHQPWLWIFGTLYPTKRAKNKANIPSLPIQLFFSLE
jgi:prepilin-type N-terminal cleavage/methylation domain-containing protein